MSRCLAYFNKDKKDSKTQFLWLLLEILAVLSPADFWALRVVIILLSIRKGEQYSRKQLTTLGQNIKALEVDGVFDDCQDMVKRHS
jgi:threonine synthase